MPREFRAKLMAVKAQPGVAGQNKKKPISIRG
jgi:hypothetical protein